MTALPAQHHHPAIARHCPQSVRSKDAEVTEEVSKRQKLEKVYEATRAAHEATRKANEALEAALRGPTPA